MTQVESPTQNILTALRLLAAQCDGAVEQDGQGFNGLDTDYGKSLASLNRLTPKQEYAAFKLLRKYRKQLKRLGHELIKDYPERLLVKRLDTAGERHQVTNLAKGTDYEVQWVSETELLCTCPAVGDCKHIAAVRGESLCPETLLDKPDPPKSVGYPYIEGDEILPGIFATDEQAEALNLIVEFLRDEERTEFLLMGYAGTGKTVLLQAVARWMHGQGKKLVFTTPTNKATGVMSEMVERWGIGVESKTAASLLKMSPKIDYKTGHQYFEPAFGARHSPSEHYDLAVVDEASMAGGTEYIGDQPYPGLFDHLKTNLAPEPCEGLNTYKKLLYSCDPFQIPPVGSKISPVFQEVKDQAVLTKVMRYQGPILEFATDIRSNPDRPGWQSHWSTSSYVDENGERVGLFVVPREVFHQQTLKAAEKGLFNGAGTTRDIAWTNKRVAALGQMIHTQVYGPDAPRFIPGQRLVMGSPWSYEWKGDRKWESQVVLKTSEEYVIRSAVEQHHTVKEIGDGLEEWRVWWLTWELPMPKAVMIPDCNGIPSPLSVSGYPVLHESERRRYSVALSKLLATAKKERNSEAWSKYWRLKQAFADVASAAALTAHKSQGSEYTTVFVDAADIQQCKARGLTIDPDTNDLVPCLEWLRLLYTAATRSRSRLIVGV